MPYTFDDMVGRGHLMYFISSYVLKEMCWYWVDRAITHLQIEVDKVEWKLIQKLWILFHALGCDKSHTKFATNLHKMHKSSEYFVLIQNDHIFFQFSLFKCILKLQTKTMIYIVVNNLCSKINPTTRNINVCKTYVASNSKNR